MDRRILAAGVALAATVGLIGAGTGPVSADTPNGTSTSKSNGHLKNGKTPPPTSGTDESGCRDLVAGDPAGGVSDGQLTRDGAVLFQTYLAAPACADVTYAFTVTYQGLAYSATRIDDGSSNLLVWSAQIPAAPDATSAYCASIEATTAVGDTVVDIAPNPGAADTDGNGIPQPNELCDGSPGRSSFV